MGATVGCDQQYHIGATGLQELMDRRNFQRHRRNLKITPGTQSARQQQGLNQA